MDEVTKKWFDVAMVQVHRAPELDGWYADEELIRLSGAPRGSRLEVNPSTDGTIMLRVVNQDLLCEPMVRRISQEANGRYVFEIHNAAFVLRPEFRQQGIGARVCRPMSTEEAMRLTRESHGAADFPDNDPLIDAEIRALEAAADHKDRKDASS
jgi:hypothetical protein